jgi:hypothetical protein
MDTRAQIAARGGKSWSGEGSRRPGQGEERRLDGGKNADHQPPQEAPAITRIEEDVANSSSGGASGLFVSSCVVTSFSYERCEKIKT